MPVRVAELKDIPGLLELCYSYYVEGNTHQLRYDQDKMTNSLYHGIIDEDKDVSLLESGSRIVGFTYSDICDQIYTNDKLLNCHILYVHKDYRVGMNGVKLIKNLTKIAKQIKVSYVYIGIISEIATERTSMLYTKLGYKEIGKDFRLEV